MEKQTANINILSLNGPMSYLIEYKDSNTYINSYDILTHKITTNNIELYLKKLKEYDLIFVNLKESSIAMSKHDLYFQYAPDITDPIILTYLPEKINISTLYLKFPQFSIDTYENGIEYILTASLYINNVKINLGSYLINRNDSIALSPIERVNDNNYFEYIKLPIINPYDITYNDQWDEFRKNICYEKLGQLDNYGSILNVTLYPVQKDSREGEDIYLTKDLYTGSQCSINLFKSGHTNNFEINLNFEEDNDEPHYNCKLDFNEKYDTLYEYYKNTYNMIIDSAQIELVFLDDNNVYKLIIQTIDVKSRIKNIIFKKDKLDPHNYNSSLYWESWNDWHPGIFARAYLVLHGRTNNILNKNEITSNTIHFTKELMKYFILDNDNFERKINLDNMEIININAINKIINQVIQVDNVDNDNNGIIYPVFYSVKEANNILLHKNVNENICINLNSFKSKVKTFYLVIENDITFTEFGRTVNGILFKIIGSSLPDKSEGTYLILDENKNFVTLGHYTCI